MPLIVRDVSAIFVPRITFRSFGPVGSKILACGDVDDGCDDRDGDGDSDGDSVMVMVMVMVMATGIPYLQVGRHGRIDRANIESLNFGTETSNTLFKNFMSGFNLFLTG